VLGICGITTGVWEAEINATALEIDLSAAVLAPETKCYVVVQLTPSGILSPQCSRQFLLTGEIQRLHDPKGAVHIATPFGTLCAEERYTHYNSHEYGDEVAHVVERAVVCGDIDIPEGGTLRDIHKSLTPQIDDICLVLSLCYRQRVSYYELVYVVRDGGERAGFREPVLRLRQRTCAQKREFDELVHYRDLIDGGLDSLIRAFRGLRDPDALRRSIAFLCASFEAESVESCYFFAYSALESVVSMVDTSPRLLLSASQWKKTEHVLRQRLDQFALESGFADVVKMKEKLLELRRTPAARHIEKVCNDLGVKTDDLWPRHGFTTGVELATSLRDNLFHSALCADPHELHAHLTRLRVLVERTTLKVLGWPDNKIWAHHDHRLKWMNMADRNRER